MHNSLKTVAFRCLLTCRPKAARRLALLILPAVMMGALDQQSRAADAEAGRSALETDPQGWIVKARVEGLNCGPAGSFGSAAHKKQPESLRTETSTE